jgi:salicylate hydroxylase
MEVYEEILANTADPGHPNIKGFRYVFGSEGHEEIFKVRVSIC